ncbi:hypothetical protein [Kangiella sp. TOML190]|uniref:hypothetical protein n=1 Tax=Kangiella sp. TOML190 TaxID=2931351 RepID=UPI00203ABD63|nr:hypothetical protein [Kangiella sp. TOML190]
MATRRAFLKVSLLGSLAVASGVSIWQYSLEDSQQAVESDPYRYQFLNQDQRLLIYALLPAYLGSALAPLDSTEFRLGLIREIDQALAFVSQQSQLELQQLLDLLSHQLGRAYVAGVWTNWNQASPAQLSSFLQDWRESFIALLRAGYLGLHQLIFGAFYAQEPSWAAIGYSGPPKLNLNDDFYAQFDE